MDNKDVMKKISGGLIVSCQALKDEPLHGATIMGKMAYAAYLGGAVGIRANSVVDIIEIKKHVPLPLIGIIKTRYSNSSVVITPTEEEVDELMACGVEIIATDATCNMRPDGKTLDEFFAIIRKKYPQMLFMADCSTVEEGLHASRIGFDIIATTMSMSARKETPAPDFSMISELVKRQSRPVIAEGGIWSPKQLRQAIDIGAHAAVVGSAITRPFEITKSYVRALNSVS